MRRIAICLLIALSFIWFGACQRCFAQQIIGRPMLPISNDPCVTCTQNASANNATMGGLTAMIYTNGVATAGLSNGKVFTVSAWVKPTSTLGIILELYAASGVRFRFLLSGTRNIQIVARNSSGTLILQGDSSVSLGLGVWSHVLVCVDLSDATKRKIYFNGVSDGLVIWSTYSNDTIQYSGSTGRSVFNNLGTQTIGLNGGLAELWMDDSYNDSPCLFYCSGKPAVVSATGQLANGASPAIYLSKNGNAASWQHDSSGNGNHFSDIVGAISSTTSP